MGKIAESTLKRLKNPAFWTGIISLIFLIFTSAGLDFDKMTTWELLGGALLSIVENPVKLIAVIGSMVGVTANTSSKGFLDGKE